MNMPAPTQPVRSRSPVAPFARLRTGALVAGAIFAAAAGAPAAPQPVPPEPASDRRSESPEPAAAALERFRAAYATCRTYQDAGESTAVFSNGFTTNRPFATWFDREAGKFRYEFTDFPYGGGIFLKTNPRLFLVWNDGSGAKTWWTLKPTTVDLQSVGFGLATAAGISGMSSTLVPPLLVGEGSSRSILENITQADHLGKHTIDGAACDHLRITIPGYPTQPEVWIDEAGFLRRFRDTQTIEGGPVTTTIDVRPTVDASIDAAVFDVVPPPASTRYALTQSFIAVLIVGGIALLIGVLVIARRLREMTRDDSDRGPVAGPSA